MAGEREGDPEDLLGQFLAHRGTPTRTSPASARPAPEPAAREPEPEAAPDDGSASDTLAHAGAVLEAFASGTLDVDAEPDSDAEPEGSSADEQVLAEARSGLEPETADRPEARPEARTEARPDARTDDRPDATAAGESVFAAFRAQQRTAPERRAPDRPVPAPRPAEPAASVAPASSAPPVAPDPPAPAAAPLEEAEPAAESPKPAPAPIPNEVVFRPRRMARTLVALILLVFIAASAAACWWAYHERTLVPVGIAATILIATGIVWATRAGTTVARLSVRGGRLEITKDGTRTVFDLRSEYTPIDVHGRPGKRGWKVVFGRRGLPPYVVDSSMVPPAEFMRVLDYYRHQRG